MEFYRAQRPGFKVMFAESMETFLFYVFVLV